MDIKYDLVKLEKILDDIYGILGLGLALFDDKFNRLYMRANPSDPLCALIQKTEDGAKKCDCSDLELVKECASCSKCASHICHAGLLDTAVPIFKNERIVAYLIIGRLRTDKTDAARLESLGKNAEFDACYQAMPYFSEEKFRCLIDLLSNLLFENAIEIKHDSFIYRAVDYIGQNLSEKITVNSICSSLYCSKNLLYRSFKSFFNCTVNEYITAERINKAKKLLAKTDMSISDVADSTGFENYSYFSRLFKKKTGTSPIQYRNVNKI